jgi:hypothetical protein
MPQILQPFGRFKDEADTPAKSPDNESGRFARPQGIELLLAGCFEHFLSGNVPTNPCR